MINKFKAKIRNGLKTIWWHPELVEGAIFDELDIPFCPTTATTAPKKIITWIEAKAIYHNELRKGNINFLEDVFVCFYIDDYKFDTFRGIWFSSKKAFSILKHFKGIITPDFSTYIDFPFALKLWNTYRMRAFGYAAGKEGLEVINNIRGRINEDFSYCCNGIELNSIIAIGTVGSGLKFLENRPQFENWLFEVVKRLKPKSIVVYGSANYSCFKLLKRQGIKIYEFESSTSRKFKERKEKNNV